MKRILCALLATILLLGTFASCTEPTPMYPDAQEEPLPGYTDAREILPLNVGDVVLNAGMLYEKEQINARYLESLDPDTLLYFFYVVADMKIPNGVIPYGGWEAANGGWSVAGHTLGHYLSAISMLYASTGAQWCTDRVTYIVDQLSAAQADNGYLMSRPEEEFAVVLRGDGSNGVMFYTLHKILAGLYDAYLYADSDRALDVASDLLNWVYDNVKDLNEAQRAAMLGVEYGGMNEVAYNIYALTEEESHLAVAEAFNEAKYLNAWANGEDNLTGIHANTQIPKAVGYARGYMVTGEETLLRAAEFFWDIVVNGRTFATGGNAEAEAFGHPEHTSDQFWFNPDETCNIYNMSKLSAYLFTITGDVKYADYMERALLNGLAGSMDEDGCKTYYQWLYTDAKKLFHTETDSFWCCTGTGMETFSKLGSMLAFSTNRGYAVNIFADATFTYQNLTVSMTNDASLTSFTFEGEGRMELLLRVPYYAAYTTVLINGETVHPTKENGYLVIDRVFKSGDALEYFTPYTVYMEDTPDDENCVAIKYGPYVLVADGMRYELKNYLAGDPGAGWMRDMTAALMLNDDGTFTLHTDDFDMPMKRYCDVVSENFTMYFDLQSDLPVEATMPDIAMRASVASDTGSAYSRTQKFGANVWYDTTTGLSTYLEALNDGMIGVDSTARSPESNDLFTFAVPVYQLSAGNHWVEYTFDEEQSVSEVSVYFYRSASVPLPKTFSVQYWDGSAWQSVTGADALTIKADTFSTMTFDGVSTTALRLVFNSASPVGIIEWSVQS